MTNQEQLWPEGEQFTLEVLGGQHEELSQMYEDFPVGLHSFRRSMLWWKRGEIRIRKIIPLFRQFIVDWDQRMCLPINSDIFI
jgi:hypothetical protein